MPNDKFWELMDQYYITSSHDYAEPSYDLEGKIGILFGNWNKVPDKLYNALEVKWQLEWEDEWTTCSECGRAIRTNPDSYHWQGSFWMGDGEIICLDCIDWDYVLDDYTNHPKRALTWPLLDGIGGEDGLKEHGWIKYNEVEFENGFFPGQNADPHAIYKKLRSEGHEKVLFAMTDQGQFDIAFDVYVEDKKEDEEVEDKKEDEESEVDENSEDDLGKNILYQVLW